MEVLLVRGGKTTPGPDDRTRDLETVQPTGTSTGRDVEPESSDFVIVVVVGQAKIFRTQDGTACHSKLRVEQGLGQTIL